MAKRNRTGPHWASLASGRLQIALLFLHVTETCAARNVGDVGFTPVTRSLLINLAASLLF